MNMRFCIFFKAVKRWHPSWILLFLKSNSHPRSYIKLWKKLLWPVIKREKVSSTFYRNYTFLETLLFWTVSKMWLKIIQARFAQFSCSHIFKTFSHNNEKNFQLTISLSITFGANCLILISKTHCKMVE